MAPRPIIPPRSREFHSVFQTPPTAASLPATIARIKVGGRPFYRHASGLRDGRGNDRLGAGAYHGSRRRLRHSVSVVGSETPSTKAMRPPVPFRFGIECLTYAGEAQVADLYYGSANAPTRRCRRRAGTCHNAGCWARHGQLTNAADRKSVV